MRQMDLLCVWLLVMHLQAARLCCAELAATCSAAVTCGCECLPCCSDLSKPCPPIAALVHFVRLSALVRVHVC